MGTRVRNNPRTRARRRVSRLERTRAGGRVVVGVRQLPVLIVCPLSQVACAFLGTWRPRNTHGNRFSRNARVPGSLVPSSTRKLASYSYGEMEEESEGRGRGKGWRTTTRLYEPPGWIRRVCTR